ncbi:MAG: four helix bundle protein [Prevotellaceae bacterium]|jgi:four helix bundle protein|nr:four helix bundle protein [Prevotellaceae bacterium]
MKNYSGFENLEVWKISMRLSLIIYGLFKECKDYGFRDQIQRASVSVPANIAEGDERQTAKESIQFLYIARGSAAEVRTFLYLAIELNYIPKEEGLNIIDQYKKISSMLYRLIETRKTVNREQSMGHGNDGATINI